MASGPESSPAEYDDRMSTRYAAVRDATRFELILGGIVVGVVLIIAGIGLSRRTTGLVSLEGIGLVVLTVFFMVVGVVLVVLIPMSRYYAIRAGLLDYPRWGGLRRGTIPLGNVTQFKREGRDESAATLFLLAQEQVVLTIPEDVLADPARFRDVLVRSGLKEAPPRIEWGH